MIRHPHQSLFLGIFPIGLATLINMIVFICVPAWGEGMVTSARVFWWIDSVMAITVRFHMTFVMLVSLSHL